jgi:hypothetical protein
VDQDEPGLGAERQPERHPLVAAGIERLAGQDLQPSSTVDPLPLPDPAPGVPVRQAAIS